MKLKNKFENKNKDIYNKFEENSANMCNEIKKMIEENNDKQNKLSSADKVNNSMGLPDVQKQVPLIKKNRRKDKKFRKQNEI